MKNTRSCKGRYLCTQAKWEDYAWIAIKLYPYILEEN